MEQSVTSDLAKIKKCFGLKGDLPEQYSPLALAYIGDTVYDMVFRTIAVASANMAPHKYHKIVCKYVSAVAQSEMVEAIKNQLTEKELKIYKRGRNAKPYHKAKNASSIEYQRATGLEALTGYLYLNDEMDRLYELLAYGLDKLENRKEDNNG